MDVKIRDNQRSVAIEIGLGGETKHAGHTGRRKGTVLA